MPSTGYFGSLVFSPLSIRPLQGAGRGMYTYPTELGTLVRLLVTCDRSSRQIRPSSSVCESQTPYRTLSLEIASAGCESPGFHLSAFQG